MARRVRARGRILVACLLVPINIASVARSGTPQAARMEGLAASAATQQGAPSDEQSADAANEVRR
jgi:hypothetical protein